MPKTKAGSIFYNDRRVAYMQGIEYSIKSNDGQEMTDSGPHNTDGIATTSVTCNVLVPVPGIGVDIVEDIINHKDVDLVLGIIDGKIHTIKGARGTEVAFTGEVASGKLTGRGTWHGPAPKIKKLGGL